MTFLFVLALISLFSCGGPSNNLNALGIKAGDSLSLSALDGTVPVILTFEDPPVSTQGTGSTQTIGVTFIGTIDITETHSPEAFIAIQGLEEISLELRFINIKREVKRFELSPIKKGDLLIKPITRQNIPFALEEIAQIVFVVDNKEVAFYPPLKK